MNENKLKYTAITKTTIEEKSQNSKKNTVVQRIFSILITQKLMQHNTRVKSLCLILNNMDTWLLDEIMDLRAMHMPVKC